MRPTLYRSSAASALGCLLFPPLGAFPCMPPSLAEDWKCQWTRVHNAKCSVKQSERLSQERLLEVRAQALAWPLPAAARACPRRMRSIRSICSMRSTSQRVGVMKRNENAGGPRTRDRRKRFTHPVPGCGLLRRRGGRVTIGAFAALASREGGR
jgi:hypothetical protein